MKNHDRFPRTLTEAFGCDAESAVAMRRYRRPYREFVFKWLLRALMVGWATLIVIGVMS